MGQVDEASQGNDLGALLGQLDAIAEISCIEKEHGGITYWVRFDSFIKLFTAFQGLPPKECLMLLEVPGRCPREASDTEASRAPHCPRPGRGTGAALLSLGPRGPLFPAHILRLACPTTRPQRGSNRAQRHYRPPGWGKHACSDLQLG